MLFIYANYPVIYSLRERERGRGRERWREGEMEREGVNLFNLARLKIVPILRT